MGYLSVQGVEAGVQYLAATYPSFCQSIALPETSVQGRTSHALKIAHGGGGTRHGVLFLGGVHARELVNPDLLIWFGTNLCQAYAGDTGLTFGGKAYNSGVVKLIVETLDLFLFPLVNPDGRAHVQDPNGDVWWRKNRSHDVASGCYGVDLNRNFDLLWSSGIGTSSSPCDYQIYKGPAAFSEPETRNVRWLLDTYPQIDCMIDIHSYSDDVLYPWGDATDQTTDPAKNFQNPAYNGLRGVANSTMYQEYTPQIDLDWFVNSGNAVVQAIQAVRGTAYTLKQSIGLYPTSGTSDDYAYSRHFVDGSKTRVYAYCLETGVEFQPPYAEALNIMSEVSAGLVQFCVECLCTITQAAAGTAMEARLDHLRGFRDRDVVSTATGAEWAGLLHRHTGEVVQLFATDEGLRRRAGEVLAGLADAAESEKPVDAATLKRAEKLAADVSAKASSELREAVRLVVADLEHFRKRSIADALRAADARRQSSR